jgi:hypothetical protein
MVSPSVRRAAAKKLRANTTPHERILWSALRELPVDGTHFRGGSAYTMIGASSPPVPSSLKSFRVVKIAIEFAPGFATAEMSKLNGWQ